MDNIKGLFQSKIFWAQIFGMVATIAGLFNFPTVVGIFNDPGLADKAVMIVGVGVQIATVLFRRTSTAQISGLVTPK
jgi:hypothetical protein